MRCYWPMGPLGIPELVLLIGAPVAVIVLVVGLYRAARR